jgi:dTDP-4-amino-4,6-dideoxygalactose transaminase
MIRIGEFKTTDEIRSYINEVLDSGRLTEGPFVKKFEDKVKGFLGVKNAIAVTNGTVSLQLIGQYLRQTIGVCRICVPAMTFPATVNAFVVTGHQLITCDIGKDLQIDIDKLSEKDKYTINVIVPVHLMGYPANMSKIVSAAEKYGWLIIEDTAEAFGGEYQGFKLGTIGHFGSFSFYVSHNITGGELGLIVTNDDEVAKKLRSMKNHGRDPDSPLAFKHNYIGSNYKTNEFCAAVALSELNHAEESLKIRYDNAKYFHDNITNSNLILYPVPEGFSPLGYPIRAKSPLYKDYIIKKLKECGIETRDIFPCLNNQVAYKGLLGKSFPMAELLEKEVFYIGVHKYLTDKDKKKIVNALSEA